MARGGGVTDDELPRLYREGLTRAASPAARDDDVPTLEAMLRVVRGEAGRAERLRTLDRVMASQALREEFALLSAVAEGERRAASSRRSWWPAAAAAAVLLLAVGLLWQLKRTPTGDVIRGDGTTVELVAPREVLDAGRLFAWRSEGAGSRYRFQLRDAQGGVLFDTLTADTTLVLPMRVPLVADGAYRWWVRATLPDGSQVRSALTPFRGSATD
jgi:hypothetical protein